MSRAFMKYQDGSPILTEKLLAKLKALSKDGKKVGENYCDTEIIPYYDNPYFNSAARLVRFFAEKHNRFMTEMASFINKDTFTCAVRGKDKYFNLCVPIVRKNKDGTSTVSVIVFDNIHVNMSANEHELSNVSWATFGYILKNLVEGIKDDQKNDKTKLRWETPQRAFKLLKRRQEMTMAKFLTNYTNLAASGSSGQIRDLAMKLEEQYVPLEIVFAEKPEHYIEMYEKGPSSCMSGKDGREWTALKKELRFHPTLWYLHNPQTQGIYARKSGKVLARSIACRDAKGKWHYTRIYASNDMAKKQMINTLKEMGIDNINSFTCTETFDVPGVFDGQDYVAPMPYLDHITSKWKATFNKEKSVFTFSPQKDKDSSVNVANQSARGFIRAGELVRRTCANCNVVLPVGHNALLALDGTIFCSGNCMAASQYAQAQRSDGIVVVVPKNQTYADCLTRHLFTNKEACQALGGIPAIINFEEPEDDSSLSTGGIQVDFQNTKYRISEADYKILNAKGKMNGRKIIDLNKRTLPIHVEIVSSMRINCDTGEVEVA